MADRVYVLSPEVREFLRSLDYQNDVPETLEESYLTSEMMGYSWTAASVAQYLYYRCTTQGGAEVAALSAMIGADFAVQMERSAHEALPTSSLSERLDRLEKLLGETTPGAWKNSWRDGPCVKEDGRIRWLGDAIMAHDAEFMVAAHNGLPELIREVRGLMERSARTRQLDTPTGSLRCLYESSQESLEQNSLARDISKLRAVIQDLLPGGSRAVQAGSELHEALANLYAALKVDIYAPPETMNGVDMERSAPTYFNDSYVVPSSKSFGFIFSKGALDNLVVEPTEVVEDGSVSWLEALEALDADGKE